MAKLTTQQWGSVMDSGTQLVELGMEASTPSTWSSRGEVARDTVKGTFKGAAAGALLGTSIAPGIGTAIGAIGGALIGFGGQAFKNGSVEGRNFADASQIQLKRGGWLGDTPWAEFRDAKDTAAGNRAALITGQRNAAEYSENADNDVAVLGRANGGGIPETPILVSKGEVYVDNEGNAEIIGGKKHKHNGKDDKVKIAKVGGFVYANSKAMEYENGETPADDAIKRLNTKKIKKVDRYSLGTLAALKLNAKILANKAEQLKEEKGLKNRPKKLVLTAKFGDGVWPSLKELGIALQGNDAQAVKDWIYRLFHLVPTDNQAPLSTLPLHQKMSKNNSFDWPSLKELGPAFLRNDAQAVKDWIYRLFHLVPTAQNSTITESSVVSNDNISATGSPIETSTPEIKPVENTQVVEPNVISNNSIKPTTGLNKTIKRSTGATTGVKNKTVGATANKILPKKSVLNLTAQDASYKPIADYIEANATPKAALNASKITQGDLTRHAKALIDQTQNNNNNNDNKWATGLGIASSALTNLAPAFSNAMAKAETEQPIYNPYMSLALATKRNLRAKANTRALREQQAISNYNANNLGTGQGLALRRQSAVDLNKAISDMYLQTQLQNNAYADNYANALIDAGNAYAAETRATREINAQNRAAQDTFRNKALSEGVAYLQGKKRDMATLNAMYPMLLSAYTEDQLKSMLLNYLMS